MGHQLIKKLDSATNLNRNLYYLDNGAADLPVIDLKDRTKIAPGSEARDLPTGDKWILNTQLVWQKVPNTGGGGTGGGGIPEIPSTPIGREYVRRAGTSGAEWAQTHFAEKSEVGNLTDLQTTDKTSIVAAINEAAQTGGGTPGPEGPQGPIGPAGAKGDKGDKGDQGTAGPIGPEGPKGDPGQNAVTDANITGDYNPLRTYHKNDVVVFNDNSYFCIATTTNLSPSEAPGDWAAYVMQGPAGLQGPIGPTGATGPIGLDGPAGPVGPEGPVGPAGPQGIQGIQGLTGAQGDKGDKGDAGDPGPDGPQGPEGQQGIQGPIGLTGPIGATGPIGPQGVQGEEGPDGPAGPQGIQGIQGIPGQNAVANLNYVGKWVE